MGHPYAIPLYNVAFCQSDVQLEIGQKFLLGYKLCSSFVNMNKSTCWSELWLGKVFQNSSVVHLMDVARRFEFGAIMQDVVCSLHLAHSHHSEPHTGPALAGAGPNARPRRGAPLSNGVITSSFSVNRAMTFLRKIFWQNNYMNIKNRAIYWSRSVCRLHDNTISFFYGEWA